MLLLLKKVCVEENWKDFTDAGINDVTADAPNGGDIDIMHHPVCGLNLGLIITLHC